MLHWLGVLVIVKMQIPLVMLMNSPTTPSCLQAGPGVLARALEYTDDVVDRAEGIVGNLIDSATGQATSMMQNVGEGVYNSMPKSLPPNLQSKADVVSPYPLCC